MRRESVAEERWDRRARFYDAAMAPLEWIFLRRWRRRAVAAMPRPAFWLEVGAGPGSNSAFYPPDARGVVSDLSLAMVWRARRRSAVPVVVADAARLPFREASFGGVLATLVFCNVPDDHAGLAELRRVLHAGGVLVMLEHVRPESRAGGKLTDIVERVTGPGGEHMNRRTVQNAARAGFDVVRVENVLGTLVRLLIARRP